MMNNIISIISIFFVLIPCFTAAAAEPQLPQILKYKDKPIDSLCFFEAGDTNSVANLNECGLHSEPGRGISGENAHLIKQGYYGYDYSWKIDETTQSQGYSYYRSFGPLESGFIIETLNNSGGTGEFSALSVIRREDNLVYVEPFVGGDRCNNGIYRVKRVKEEGNDRLVYSINITAFDFLDLAQNNPHGLSAYDDLDSCAACCLATAVFERPINPKLGDAKLLYVDLAAYPQETNHVDEANGAKYQACFDKLLAQYKKPYNGKLDPRALAEFTKAFNKTCVGE